MKQRFFSLLNIPLRLCVQERKGFTDSIFDVIDYDRGPRVLIH